MPKTDLFARTGHDNMNRGPFYLIIGSILAWGCIATYIVSSMTAMWRPSALELLIVGLVIPLLGVLLSISDSAALSFVGFNLVAIPFGATLGPLLYQYNISKPGLVTECALLTAFVAGVMAISGFLFPNFYRSIGGVLFGALTTLVVVLIVSMFVPQIASFGIVQWGSATIFALYIGYDMWRASDIPATLDNAVDVALSLYLDVINLFLSLLDILDDD